MKSLEAVACDHFAQHLGLELIFAAEGRSQTRMIIRRHHINGVGTVHGGAIFALADYALATAANSHGFVAVSVNGHISFLKAVRQGTLYAEAEEVTRTRRFGAYSVVITDDTGDVVALFQGQAYRRDRSVGEAAREG